MGGLSLKPLCLGWPPFRIARKDPATVPAQSGPITLIEAQQTSLEVTWPVPDDGGSPILNYTLRWQKVGEGTSEAMIDTTNSATITDLDPGSEYSLDVWATNAIGDGQKSEPPVTFITLEAPDPEPEPEPEPEPGG